MTFPSVTLALPTRDRRRAFAFFSEALGLEAFGEPASDGVPEPLQFAVSPGLNVMFIPRGGFGWVTGGREIAQPGTSECLVSIPVDSRAEVDALYARARAAGAEEIAAPEQKPWAYEGVFADPDGHLWALTVL